MAAAPPLVDGQKAADDQGNVIVWNARAKQWTNQAAAQAEGASTVAPEASKRAQARLAGFQTDADTITRLAKQAHTSLDYNAKTPTGGILGAPLIGGLLTDAAAVPNDKIRAMDSLSVQMAKDMRAIGQRLTQMEWQKNLTAVTSPRNSWDANRDITADIDRARVGASAKSSFYARWIHDHGDDTGADAAWLNFYNHNFDQHNNFVPGKGQASTPPQDDSQWKVEPVN